MNEIQQAWTYIAEWLDKEARDHDRKSLAPGTDEIELNGFENEFNKKLPKDFRQSYLIHNGFAKEIGLVHGGDLLQFSQIRKRYYRLTHRNSPVIWNPDLLPIVLFNETDYFTINLQTEQIYWTAIKDDGTLKLSQRVFASFSEFLSELAHDLKVGNGSMGEMLG